MKLADVCEINPKTEQIADETLVSFVAMPNVSEDGRIEVTTFRSYGEVKKGFTCFKDGDVLFAKITPCMENGKGALAVGLKNGIGCGSTEFHVLRPKENCITGKWLYYLTAWSVFRVEAERHMTGSAGQKRVPKSFLENYELNVPSIKTQEQQTIQLDRIRRIIDYRVEELAALDDLIKSRFVELFGDLEINTKGYEKEPLQKHADVLVGYPFKSEGYTEEGVGIVGGYNLMQGFIVWEDCKYWPDTEGFDQYLLKDGDIVMAMDRPWVNGGFKIATVDKEHLPALLIQRTACIRGKDVEQEYLYSLLNSHWFADHCNITGSLVPHISNKDINSYEIILPPIEEQKAYAEFVRQVDKSKVVVQKALDEAQLLFDSLMQQYFG